MVLTLDIARDMSISFMCSARKSSFGAPGWMLRQIRNYIKFGEEPSPLVGACLRGDMFSALEEALRKDSVDLFLSGTMVVYNHVPRAVVGENYNSYLFAMKRLQRRTAKSTVKSTV